MMSQQKARIGIREWIISSKGTESYFSDSDPFISSGILDSLGVMTLIVYVESLLGRPLEDEELKMEHFQSIEAIANAYFEG